MIVLCTLPVPIERNQIWIMKDANIKLAILVDRYIYLVLELHSVAMWDTHFQRHPGVDCT